MGVRETLLALMSGEPKHGYQLKSEYETVAAPQQPLNVGQVYTTIDRLVRAGLVEDAVDAAAASPDARRRPYRLTSEGRDQARAWFFEAPVRPRGASSDVSQKVLVALQTGEVDALDVVQAQRKTLLGELRGLRHRPPAGDLLAGLGLDWKASQIESELAWLDRTEAELRARKGTGNHRGDGREPR